MEQQQAWEPNLEAVEIIQSRDSGGQRQGVTVKVVTGSWILYML